MKKQSIFYISLLLLSGSTLSVHAQEDETATETTVTTAKKKAPMKATKQYPMMEVKGKVIDARTKAPLAGIQLQTLGNNRYTAMTEEDGSFIIKVPTFSTALYVHAPEYSSVQVPIDKNGTIMVEMLSDKFAPMYDKSTSILAVRKMTETNTTSKTIETDIANRLGADVRAITRSGSPGIGASMFIRGLNSINSNAQPLIVVDGIIQDMQTNRTALHIGDYNNLLLNINPEDIEDVTVLKNGTALYGAKGGNGVILIQTKRGHSMATRIDANIGVGFELKPQLPDVMDAGQYRLYATDILGTFPSSNKVIDQLHFLNDTRRANGNRYYETFHNNTDWSKEVFQTALVQNYNINVQGGDNVGMYNLSLGYTDGESTAKKNGFNRLNVRFNSDISIFDKLTTKFDMSYTKVNRDVFDDGVAEDLSKSTITSPTFLALIKAPILNPYVYDTNGNLSTTLAEADNFLTPLDEDLTLANPTALLANGSNINKNRVENTWFNVLIAPTLELTKNLKLTETFSYSLNRNSQRYYRPKNGVPTFLIEGIGKVSTLSMSLSSKENSVMSDTRLEFEKSMGAHYLNAYAGFRYTNFSYDDNIPQGQYAPPAGNDKNPNITMSMNYRDATGANDSWKNLTWYANADYNYRNRYFVTATVAMESSSRFGSKADGLNLMGVRWGVFPGIHAGWVMTNEEWFPKNIAINYLRVNAGYDISGNDDISNYAARTSFGVVKYLYQSTGAQLNNIGNEKIQWEQTGKLNFGLQAFLLENRLGVNLDVFFNHTSNLLTLKNFDNPVAGINSYWSNGGSLDNRGFEFTLAGKPVVSKDFNIELGASVGHYNNKIASLPNNNKLYLNGVKNAVGYTSSIYGDNNIATIVGESAGVFYGYKTSGVFATDAEAKASGNADYLYMIDETGAKKYFKAGDMHFNDINNDGKISDEDKTIIGNPNPDIYGNIFANIMWKNFTLGIGFNYSLGNDVYNYQRSLLEGETTFYNQSTAVNNRWHYEGQQTSMPRATYGDPMGNSRFSDRWIEDGSYLRLKTVNLAYKVPVPSTWSWLQGLTVWAEASNLFTITRYLGSDPEFSVYNNVLYQGIDAGYLGQSRTFTFGLKINL